MTRDEAVDAGAKALRAHDMKGRITVEWDRLPNSQKRKWREKAKVVLAASVFGSWRDVVDLAMKGKVDASN